MAIVGAMLIFAPKQPVSFFFARVTSNERLAVLVGVHHRLAASAMDLHRLRRLGERSEETVDPRRRAPWGMVMAVVVSSVVGYLLLFALTLAIKDIPSVLSAKDASGNPVPAVFMILQTALGVEPGRSFLRSRRWRCGSADCRR